MALEIFRAISNLRMVLDSETDADSPNNETTYKAMREMIEILYQLMVDTGDSGTATSNPPNDTTGVLTDTGAAYDADEHNGRTLLICSGDAKGNFYTIDDTTSTTIVCTGDNLYSDGVRSGDDYKIFYDIKSNTDGHDHDGVNSAAPALADSSVTQAKLKTTISSVSRTNSEGVVLLPGGTYGFFPQTKMSSTSDAYFATFAGNTTGYVVGWTDYATNIYAEVAAANTMYFYQRYVTSSGEVYWIFILRDKATKEIISVWQAPDHPCFGNGGKPKLTQHPFPDYNDEKQEIIVINPSEDQILEMKKKIIVKSETEPDKDLIEVLLEEYEIDETIEPDWPSTKVTVGLPCDWEDKPMGSSIKPVKKKIPKPAYIKTARLKLRDKK